MIRYALTLSLLLASTLTAASPQITTESVSAKSRAWMAEAAAVDAFFRVCVLAQGADAARATSLALGGLAETDSTAATSFEFNFSGTPAKGKLGSPELCMLSMSSAEFKPAMQTFFILLQKDTFLPGIRIVDDRGMDFDDYADDQYRPSLGDEVPSDAVVRWWVEVVQAVPKGSIKKGFTNMRLLILTKPMTGARGSIFFVREIHSNTVEIQPPRPPLPPGTPRSHTVETPPAIVSSSQAANPPIFPEAAKKICAYGTVRLRTRFDANGAVLEVAVDGSSGNSALDAAAVAAARHWRINPGTLRGQPVAGEALQEVKFLNPCSASNLTKKETH